MTAESIFWTYSAAAQALGGVIGFLLAGYALVEGIMEGRLSRDETLAEVVTALRSKYHGWLSVLVFATAMAIATNLAVVYFNSASAKIPPGWQIAGATLTLGSLAGAVWFVIVVVSPKKYEHAARSLARQQTPALGAGATAEAFFTEFVAIEALIRSLWSSRADGRRISQRTSTPTLREMLEVLKISEAVPSGVLERVDDLVKTRNLVFHGHLREVHPSALAEARDTRQELERLVST